MLAWAGIVCACAWLLSPSRVIVTCELQTGEKWMEKPTLYPSKATKTASVHLGTDSTSLWALLEGWTPFFPKDISTFGVLIILVNSAVGPNSPIAVQLGWDLLTIKIIGHDLNHVHTPQTIQWPMDGGPFPSGSRCLRCFIIGLTVIIQNNIVFIHFSPVLIIQKLSDDTFPHRAGALYIIIYPRDPRIPTISKRLVTVTRRNFLLTHKKPWAD